MNLPVLYIIFSDDSLFNEDHCDCNCFSFHDLVVNVRELLKKGQHIIAVEKQSQEKGEPNVSETNH